MRIVHLANHEIQLPPKPKKLSPKQQRIMAAMRRVEIKYQREYRVALKEMAPEIEAIRKRETGWTPRKAGINDIE